MGEEGLEPSREILCIYTTTLEPILARIAEFDERLRAPPKSGLRLNKIFFHFFDFARTHFLFSIKEEENFVSAFCPDGQAEACANVPLGRRGRRGLEGKGVFARPRFPPPQFFMPAKLARRLFLYLNYKLSRYYRLCKFVCLTNIYPL